MPKFKSRIYVKQELDGKSIFLTASDDVMDLAEMEESVQVAVYELVATKTLRVVPELK